jgi:hypothetical protein
MMQPIMSSIIECANHSNHRVVQRTFTFWRHFVSRLVPGVIKNNTRPTRGNSNSVPELSTPNQKIIGSSNGQDLKNPTSSMLPQNYNERVQQSLIQVCRLLTKSAGYPHHYDNMDPDDRKLLVF